MKLNILLPTLLISSLSVLGCQQEDTNPTQGNDTEAVSATSENTAASSQSDKVSAQDVTFKKVPFDYQLPKNVADNCVDSDTYSEGQVGCPGIDVSLAQIEPKWIENVINLAITEDNSSQYIKFKRNLDAFAQSQMEDESPMGYSQTIEPEQLDSHNNVAQFSILSDVYLGGAHGMPNLAYYIFDMDMQTQVGLYDVIDDPDDRFYQLARIEFSNYLANEMDIVTPEQIADYEETWPFSISDEFYFGQEGLVLVYQPYELGSFAQGFIKLTIPYAMLEGVLRPEYL